MRFKKFKFKNVKSTNSTAMRIIQSTQCKYGMIISDSQISGRGQYGRKWISYKGNIFLSIFYRLDKINLSIGSLTKKNCYLVKNVISKYYKKKITFKSPNDLLINKKKICGILQEKISKLNKMYLIVGIGINLIKNPNLKNYPTTNLSELLNKKVSKNKIEKQIKKIFEVKLNKLNK